jgi:hypothetical protein
MKRRVSDRSNLAKRKKTYKILQDSGYNNTRFGHLIDKREREVRRDDDEMTTDGRTLRICSPSLTSKTLFGRPSSCVDIGRPDAPTDHDEDLQGIQVSNILRNGTQGLLADAVEYSVLTSLLANKNSALPLQV